MATKVEVTSDGDALSLRERTRRAVQGELIDVATRLFVENGYEATTVDQIASAAGVSRRSFFRYFPTKDDLVLSKYDRTGEDLAAALRARPADEPLWASLRSMLDHVVDYAASPERAASMAALEEVVASSDVLRGAYLARIDALQRDLAEIVRIRADEAGHPWPDCDPAPRALVGAAFACLRAATEHSRDTGADLGRSLDRTMAAVAPLDGAPTSARPRRRTTAR